MGSISSLGSVTLPHSSTDGQARWVLQLTRWIRIMAATVRQSTAYCFKCNEYRQVGESRYATSNSGRQVLKGTCRECRSEVSRYADDSSATSGMPNAGESLLLRCPSCGQSAGKQCVERQVGNAWDFRYPANIHRARAALTTTDVKSASREAARREEAAEAAKRDAKRKAMWKEAGICLAIGVFVLLTLGLGILLLNATRKP